MNERIIRMMHLATALALVLMTNTAWAQWELDAEHSAINFVSVKNDAVAEVHHFGSLLGYIGDDGKIQLVIDLGSVETAVPDRNKRMRDLLFETVKFPSATISGQVAAEVAAEVAAGGTVSMDLPVTLSLHGVDLNLTIPVLAWGEGNGRLRVVTRQPVLVRAADFGLAAGVDALRDIAHLKAISYAVPVTVNLVFTPAS